MSVTRHVTAGLAITLVTPWGSEAQRPVSENVLISAELPAVRIAVDSTLTYVGTQSLVLFGRTDAEQHFFVDADGSRLRRMLWVQFEGKRPNDPGTYNYSRYPVMDIGGHPFHHDGRFFEIRMDEERSGSDFRGALEFLQQHGYSLGPDVMRQRLVWLLDDPARNELMIIYFEDLQDRGLALADLEPGGKAAERWDEIADALLSRAVEAMTFSDPPSH
ncbi:MAG: hypothetical protein HKM89_14940 [Gemmatimonadales bacterium]|nr:hypothetical protein [Gemmatimonadales bacterium]